MKRSQIKHRLTKNFLAGFSIALGLLGGGIFAVAVTGTFNTFTSGSVIKASEVNTNFATLKAAIEGIPTEKSWRLIYENDVTSTTSSIVVSGLNGDSDLEYMIFTKFVGATAGNGEFLIELNGDSTNANYIIHTMAAVNGSAPTSFLNSTVSGAGLQINSTSGSTLTAGTIFISKLLLFAKTGTRRIALFESGKTLNTSESVVSSGSLWWGDTSSNITSMRFFFSNGNGIGVGSRIEIWTKR